MIVDVQVVPRASRVAVGPAVGDRLRVAVTAPPGYGKSTLAAQWREELVRDGVAVAWLTIDDDDNNVVWFLAHLLESLRRVRPAPAIRTERSSTPSWRRSNRRGPPGASPPTEPEPSAHAFPAEP